MPQALENTEKIARRCNFDFEFGNTKLPYYETPDGMDHYAYFQKLCREGMVRRYGQHPPKAYAERLEYELNTIQKMGYTDYYLIVVDFVQYAKDQGIPVGPGRGSGAGSIAAYCIGITDIDPMKYDLLFERFLNPERVSMPDIDVDFCFERRQEVIDYVVRKYGKDRVAQIVTFGTLAARGVLRDVGRVMDMPYAFVDSIAKMVPQELNITLDRALKTNPEFKTLYDTNEQVKELVDMSMRLERYYRVNMTPYFISERTPSEGREDLWELLEAVGLDYYDRFEWLLRTNMRCGTDNLIVERAEEARHISFESVKSLPDNLQPSDCVAIKGLQSIATTPHQLRKNLLQILRSGAAIWDEAEGRHLSEAEGSLLLNLLMLQESMENKQNKKRHQAGVDRAKSDGKYVGRKKIAVDKNLFRQVAEDFRAHKVSEEEAMSRTGIASRSTFYRRLKEI